MSKATIFNTIIFFMFFFFIKAQSQKPSKIIKEIYPYYLNITATYLSLDDPSIKRYAYFSFDFSDEKMDNFAYFKISTESVLYQTRIQYLFFDKELDEISNDDVEKIFAFYYIKGHNYRKEKTEQGFDTYIKIEKLKNNGKSLIIRIDVEQLKGDITIENMESIPEVTPLNKNIYKDNYPHNHERYHNNVINNEQRYNVDNEIIRDRYYHYHKDWRYHSHDKVHEENPITIIYGLILIQVWIIIFCLYCTINRRKNNTQRNVIINNNIQ